MTRTKPRKKEQRQLMTRTKPAAHVKMTWQKVRGANLPKPIGVSQTAQNGPKFRTASAMSQICLKVQSNKQTVWKLCKSAQN